jgi:hypothetical protein
MQVFDDRFQAESGWNIKLGNKCGESAGNLDEFPRLSIPQSSVVFSNNDLLSV